jgi:NAD(P)-dependent dehydrogenase (short-subunit alcohol dehydrogenase family)
LPEHQDEREELDDEDAANGVAEEIRTSQRRAVTVRADLGRLSEIEAMVAAVEEGLGAIDVLVNNAGVFPRVPFLELSESDWDYVLDVNLKGACFCAQAVAKRMVAAGRPGAIINLTSGAAYRGSPRGLHYCASKGGVLSMTRQMALELAPHRIRVNAIAPGLVETEMLEAMPLRNRICNVDGGMMAAWWLARIPRWPTSTTSLPRLHSRVYDRMLISDRGHLILSTRRCCARRYRSCSRASRSTSTTR